MRLGDWIAAAERVRDKKGATIALFHWRLSKIIILSAAVRISLIPWAGGGLSGERSKPAECRRKGWIAGVRCGVWSALLALSTVSTPTNRRFCRCIPTISLPSSYTRARLIAISTRLSIYAARCLCSWCLCSRVSVPRFFLYFITVPPSPLSTPSQPMFSFADNLIKETIKSPN